MANVLCGFWNQQCKAIASLEQDAKRLKKVKRDWITAGADEIKELTEEIAKEEFMKGWPK